MNQEAISEYILEKYVLRELGQQKMEALDRRVAADPALRARVREIEASNRETLAQYPPASEVSEIMARFARVQPVARPERLRQGGLFRKWALRLSPALALAVMLLILFLPRQKHGEKGAWLSERPEKILVKGPAAISLDHTQLLVHRKRNAHVELLRNGDLGRAGDLLQLAYVAARESFGVILSIDGQGRVTRHYPTEAYGSCALVRQKKVLLSNAFELDDAPGFERFFFVTAEEKIDAGRVFAKAVELAKDPARAGKENLDLPGNIKQYSVIISKGDPS